MIIFFTNALLPKKEKLVRWINNLVILLFNVQMVFILFGGSFLSLIMLTNIPSLHGLAGRIFLYSFTSVLVLVISFLKVKHFPMCRANNSSVIITCLVLELVLTMVYGSDSSQAFGWYTLGKEIQEYSSMRKTLISQENVTVNFYQRVVRNYLEKPTDLPDLPNIVLIMTEGLSQSIVEDERQITPNILDFQKKSLTFTNYYNHTFATYRGIIGQLYSGYQFSNLDTNTLTSIQSILADKGYSTSFINTEPNNLDFTHYLESMGFQQIISDKNLNSGSVNTASDKEAYELLFKTIQEEGDQPFFVVMYTYGTHVTLDSTDTVFGDGKNAFLNKFHDMDHQFGIFMNKLNDSALSENTLVIFTADHSTYHEEEYATSMSDGNRLSISCDRIPLSFYYPNIETSIVDAEGRNSIDLAPTILDYLDISAPNYYLGTSLFSHAQNDNTFDKIYYDGSKLLSTKNLRTEEVSADQESIVMPLIKKYLTAKTQLPKEP